MTRLNSRSSLRLTGWPKAHPYNLEDVANNGLDRDELVTQVELLKQRISTAKLALKSV